VMLPLSKDWQYRIRERFSRGALNGHSVRTTGRDFDCSDPLHTCRLRETAADKFYRTSGISRIVQFQEQRRIDRRRDNR
jgi:hypothetical protein